MTNTREIDFSWLEQIIDAIPKESKFRRNLIEIAGYPHWEKVISNFLGFYFDEEEEHNLKRLFFDSLIEIIRQKSNSNEIFKLFAESFVVEREVNNIDILIRSTEDLGNIESEKEDIGNISWAVIIENKMHAPLYNDLERYWKSVSSKNKIGVVLSLKPIDLQKIEALRKKKIEFVSILYKELIPRIKLNLAEYFYQSDDRHLLFLKDFFENIESFYDMETKDVDRNKLLVKFEENRDRIETVNQTEKELYKWLWKQIYSAFENNGFNPIHGVSASHGRHFYPDKDKLRKFISVNDKFRFYVYATDLIYKSRITAYFELYDSATKVGDKLKNKLKSLVTENENIKFGSGGRVGGTYYHIFSIVFDLKPYLTKTDVNHSLHEEIEKLFLKKLFQPKTSPIHQAISELQKLK